MRDAPALALDLLARQCQRHEMALARAHAQAITAIRQHYATKLALARAERDAAKKEANDSADLRDESECALIELLASIKDWKVNSRLGSLIINREGAEPALHIELSESTLGTIIALMPNVDAVMRKRREAQVVSA